MSGAFILGFVLGVVGQLAVFCRFGGAKHDE